MSARISSVVLEAHDLPRVAAFWKAALGYEPTYSSDAWISLGDPKGKGIDLAVQRATDPKNDVNRVHVDLAAPDVAAEVDRLVKLGAKRVAWPHYPPNATFVVLEDPEGNEFCVVPES